VFFFFFFSVEKEILKFKFGDKEIPYKFPNFLIKKFC